MALGAHSPSVLQSLRPLCSALVSGPALLVGVPLVSVPHPHKGERPKLIKAHLLTWAQEKEG